MVSEVVADDDEAAKASAQSGIEAGINPLKLINDGIRPALDLMGDRFSAGGSAILCVGYRSRKRPSNSIRQCI